MRGEERLGTVCGGLCTLVIVITFFTFMGINIAETFQNPRYAQTYTVDYVASSLNSKKFEIDTKNQTLAMRIGDSLNSDTSHTSKTLRVLFQLEAKDGYDKGESVFYNIPTALCTDFYAEEIAAEDSKDGFFTSTFNGTGWVCPDTTNITLWNTLHNIQGAFSVFQAEVRSCSFAKSVSPDSFYDNTEAGEVECKDGHLKSPDVTDFSIITQFVRTIYNIQTKSLQHVSTLQSQALNLDNDISYSTTSPLSQNTVRVDDTYFSSAIETYYTYSAELGFIYKDTKKSTTSYFKAVLAQDPLESTTVYSTTTLTDLFQRIGGLGSIVLGISALFMTTTSSFLQTKNLLEQLYNEELEQSSVAIDPNADPSNSDKQKFRNNLENRLPFTYGRWTFFFFNIWAEYFGFLTCACCKRRSNWCGQKLHRYKKFVVARERLMKEQDLYEIMRLNRIATLLHKIMLLPRQRRSADFFYRHTVKDGDVEKYEAEQKHEEENEKKQSEQEERRQLFDTIEKLLEGFDADTDEIDKWILFEVAGIDRGDFLAKENSFAKDGNDQAQMEQAQIDGSAGLSPMGKALNEFLINADDDDGGDYPLDPHF